MSEIDWREVYDSLKAQREDVERRLREELADLDAGMRLATRMLARQVPAPSQVPTPSATAPPRKSGPYADMSLLDAAVAVLREEGVPMTHLDISARVRMGGKDHETGSAYTLLQRAVKENRLGLVRVDGKFSLKADDASESEPRGGQSPLDVWG